MPAQQDDHSFLLSLRNKLVGPGHDKHGYNEFNPLPMANLANMFGIYTDLDPLDPFQHAFQAECRDRLKQVLSMLSLREKTVIILRFGLVDGVEHTLKEIGIMFGVSRMRIGQIEAKALKKMRHPSRSRTVMGLIS